MSIESDVRTLLRQFDEENPALKGKAYATSSNRTWDEQLEIILQPKRKGNYLNIKKRFLDKFALAELPAYDKLDSVQRNWWQTAIMAQAGRSPGFPHVGGRAQDVSVKNLDVDAKKKLKAKIETRFKILLERVNGTESVYGDAVSMSGATVFHCYK